MWYKLSKANIIILRYIIKIFKECMSDEFDE